MIYDIESKSSKPNKTYAYVQFWFENNKRRLKTVIGWHVTAQNEYFNRLKNTIGYSWRLTTNFMAHKLVMLSTQIESLFKSEIPGFWLIAKYYDRLKFQIFLKNNFRGYRDSFCRASQCLAYPMVKAWTLFCDVVHPFVPDWVNRSVLRTGQTHRRPDRKRLKSVRFA